MQSLAQHQDNFLIVLERFLGKFQLENSGEKELLEACKYSVLNKEAKFIRSFLVLEVAKMLNATQSQLQEIIKIAISVELLHAYSLIHDDLPCMDNSDFRRQKPSLHKVYKESTALMAGSGLLTLCFQLLTEAKPPEQAVKIILVFSKMAGIFGILAGQVLDLEEKTKKSEFQAMNYNKTGKLLEFCTFSPALFLSKPMQELKNFGKELGFLYQMVDDLLDEGEEGYSYLKYFTSKAKLQEEILKSKQKCQNAIKSFQNNETLLNLVEVISSRAF